MPPYLLIPRIQAEKLTPQARITPRGRLHHDVRLTRPNYPDCFRILSRAAFQERPFCAAVERAYGKPYPLVVTQS